MAAEKGKRMEPTICVPKDMVRRLAEFADSEGMRLHLVTDGPYTVRVAAADPRAEEREECDDSTLHMGGWIRCPVAVAAAARLDISTRKMGKLLDLLDIKVRECGLGCF